VLHTRPDRPHATREPLQLGAEIYGHAGLEADLEALLLALDCLKAAGVQGLSVDLADARIVRSLLAGVPVDSDVMAQVHAALATKDASALAALTRDFADDARQGLLSLVQLYGDGSVLDAAEKQLGSSPAVREALASLRWLASRLGDDVAVTFDLADLRGYAYYSGVRFAIYARGASDAVVRGGRYDGVGAVFGHKLDRERPAVGFSMDLKQLVGVAARRPLRAAVRAPWSDSAQLRAAIASLRSRGETVVCVLPGHEREIDEFQCDRELIEAAGHWIVQAI
jgi:ATP phosphoribosyltransferase regulatory subunit